MERYLWTNGAIRVSEANEFCEMSEQESDIVRWVSMKKWGEADGSISYTTIGVLWVSKSKILNTTIVAMEV